MTTMYIVVEWGEELAMFFSCGHTVEHVALRLYWGRVPTRNERSATNNTNIYQPFQVLLTYHFSFSILGKLHIFYSFLGTLTKQETGNCGNCFKTGGGVNPIPTSIFYCFFFYRWDCHKMVKSGKSEFPNGGRVGSVTWEKNPTFSSYFYSWTALFYIFLCTFS